MKAEEREWLINEFPKYKGRMLKGQVVSNYLEAERILLNRQTINKRECDCDNTDMARQTDRLYERWLEQG